MPQRDRLHIARHTRAHVMVTALMLATGSMAAQALSLGRFQTLSGIGEPLHAEIEITSLSAQEAQGLRAQIAGPRAFQQQGMEYNPALEGLNSRIENRSDGRTVIVLRGQKPVQDNFIDLILETQWNTGRLTHNYAVLLSTVADKPQPARVSPPVAPAATPAATELAGARVEYNARNIPVYRFDNPDTTPSGITEDKTTRSTAGPQAPLPLPTPALNRDRGMTDRTVLVEKGQTASELAVQHMPASVSLDQMLIAMLRENPQAFIRDNVNLVRAGAQLRMPTEVQARQLSPQDARQQVLAQHREFAEYARRIAQSPLQMGKEQDREVTGSVVDKATASQAPAPVQDKLTLSKAADPDSQEAILAAQGQAREASAQIDALEKNVAELSRLANGAAEPGAASAAPFAGTESRPIWLWGAALAALLGLGLWWRNRRQTAEPVFAPAYEDEPALAPQTAMPGQAQQEPIPSQMSSINLDLPDNPTPSPIAAAPARPEQDTEAAKLELARVLIAKGDTAIARTLIESVLATGSPRHHALAQKMLSQVL